MGSPINVVRLQEELKNHPDRNFVDYLCNEIKFGFDTLVEEERITRIKESRNLQSALKQPVVVDELVSKELPNNFVVGPFDQPPYEHYRVSPIGVAESKYSKKKRLIVDLSSPHGDGDHSSINSLIDKEQCSLKYIKVDDAVQSIKMLGKGTWLCKTDISNAFKLLGIKQSQWNFYMFKWKGKYYVCTRLVFGSRSSPVIFDTLSKAICWIAKKQLWFRKHISPARRFSVSHATCGGR